uniref:exocyst complex component EXO70B1-like n=1 Tax=Erigeron canadensis TaxID=72917 RepID=UPI001CB94776|nr:exocyst complex component EXO70B1-like [Erigeron canadensis]
MEKNSRKSKAEKVVDDQDESLLNLDQISADIDKFIDELSIINEKCNSPEIPNIVDTFVRILESKIKSYNSIKSGTRLVKEDENFIKMINRLARLNNVLSQFPSTTLSNDIQNVVQHAMILMEEEFRALLQDSNAPTEPVAKGAASKHNLDSSNHEDFPGYSNEKILLMSRIATVMISAGYQYECCQAYSTIRKDALIDQIKRFEFEKLNVEDVHKSKWVSLEPDITRWVKITNHCSKILIPAERKLGENVFTDQLPVFASLFLNLIRNITTLLLEFAIAVANVKPKGKRLFKFIDMYEAIRDLGTVVDESDFGDTKLEEWGVLKSEILSTGDNIGEAVVNMFSDLKNAIRNDTNKTTVQGGAVHPLTRYVMNYMKCGFDEYQTTLENVFQYHNKHENEPLSDVENSSLSKQFLCVIDLLEANLETKSTLYKDPPLRYIFLMNNFRYILQLVKGTNEMKQMIGDNWCRRKSSDVRNYHKSYQRETWTKLLHFLTQEGVQVNGKPNRKILKERFKSFNTMFDEIHKTQSSWVVSDEQLLSEIRVSITAVVSPAYRSFVGRYKPQFEGGKSIDKYIKYQPEDIESLIETLFEGTEKVESQMNGIQAVSTVKQTTGAFKNLLKTYKNVGLM